MRRVLALALGATLALSSLPGAVLAQGKTETLADIRVQLTQLGGELASLRSELMSTGSIARMGGSSALERMESMELELMRLTGRTEEIEMKVKRILLDGTNRLEDLEFRVVELEGGDTSSLGSTPLGGGAAAPAPAAPIGAMGAPPAKPTSLPQEQADFDRAREVLGQGDFRGAEDLLAAHAATWGSGPLSGEVLFLHGEAIEAQGDVGRAARSYLDSFTSYPDGPRAAEAMFRLGRALGVLQQGYEACLTLGEVGTRYPGHPIVVEAEAERARLQCQ